MRWRRRPMRWRRGPATGTHAQPGDGERAVPQAPAVVPDHVLVFVHIPKCGGTTVHEWLDDVLAPGVMSPERLRMPAELAPDRAAALRQHRVFSGHFDTVDLANLPTPQRRFTVLRDPVDRIVSLYDFWRAHDPAHIEQHDLAGPRAARAMTFDEFARGADARIVHDLDNTYVRTFTGRIRTSDPIDDRDRAVAEAVDFVGSLDHVGHLDRLADTFAWLVGDLGLDPTMASRPPDRRNVRGEWNEPYLHHVQRTEPSPAALAALEPLVELDRELIARCCR